MKTAVVRARCEVGLKEEVVNLAKRLHLEEADIVRLALVEYVAKYAQATSLPVPTETKRRGFTRDDLIALRDEVLMVSPGPKAKKLINELRQVLGDQGLPESGKTRRAG